MSSRQAPLRAYPPGPPSRPATILALAIMLAGLGAAGVAAESPPRAHQLSAEQARAAGLGLALIRRSDLAPGLVALVPAPGAAGARSSASGQLLAVAPGGDAVATVDRVGLDPAQLSIARSDGSQLHLDLAGVQAAAFAPDAAWLAVADGAGQLWRIGSADGERRLIAAGPFIGPLNVSASGEVLALAVASVEAPFDSRLVRVAAETGAWTALSDETLVYGATPLADGSIAVVSHRPQGTVVQVVRDGRAALVANLGPGAINVSVAATGTAVAWERSSDGIYLLDTATGRTRRLGAGSNPILAPDGASLLVADAGALRLMRADGATIATIDVPAGFAACGKECGS